MMSRVIPIVLVALLCVALMTEAAAVIERKSWPTLEWNKVVVIDPEEVEAGDHKRNPKVVVIDPEEVGADDLKGNPKVVVIDHPEEVGDGDRKRNLGGWTKVPVTDPEVQEVAAKATAHIEKARNSARVYRLQEVSSAAYQIVRGKNFKLTLRIGQTDCLRRANVDVEKCSIVKVERCDVTVLVWQSTSEVTEFTCKNEEKALCGGDGCFRLPTTLPGGPVYIAVDNEKVIEAATFATEELTRRSNGRYTVQRSKIAKATYQVLSGYMYRLTIDVTVDKPNSDYIQISTCNVRVWDHAERIPRFTLEEYSCDGLIP